MLEIKHVSKRYDDNQVLNNVSFQIGKGLHYIVGPSGSGKSTLLKILCGMDQEYEGDVFYQGESITSLNEIDKSYFYHHVFGFVWQNYNLLEHKTVLENVCLPEYLKQENHEVSVSKILKELGIAHLAHQKVKSLSGGQKQRVALARELVKNPKVIIADEPSSALDEKSANIVMEMLRKQAKQKIVIIVTHNTSLISGREHVMKLEKGCLYTEDQPIAKPSQMKRETSLSLSLSHAFSLASENMKRSIGRVLLTITTCIIASLMLLTTCSGILNSSSNEEIDKLFDMYGESLLDLNLTSSFMSAAGTDDKEEDKPNANVNQDISKLYDRYFNDERIQFALFTPAFNEIEIKVGEQKTKVESSGNVPVINRLLTGKYPDNTKKEVLVPESFVKKIGKTNETVLGTNITFTGTMTKWENERPQFKKVQVDVEIVGVIDTTMSMEYEGKKMEYSIDDSFIFGKTALDEMKGQAGMANTSSSFTMRAKTPNDLIAIKDELNKEGIVPIGQFELVEDYLRLGNQSNTQSGFANGIIVAISILSSILIFITLAMFRKREFAIYKLSGFHQKHLNKLFFVEIIQTTIVSIVLLLLTSPILNMITQAMLSMNILQANPLMVVTVFLCLLGVVNFVIHIWIARKSDVAITMRSGDNS